MENGGQYLYFMRDENDIENEFELDPEEKARPKLHLQRGSWCISDNLG